MPATDKITGNINGKITNGPNDRAVGETIAATGPGIPDEALAPGEKLPEPPSDMEVARIARLLDAPVPAASAGARDKA